jgi:hypothetical protein
MLEGEDQPGRREGEKAKFEIGKSKIGNPRPTVINRGWGTQRVASEREGLTTQNPEKGKAKIEIRK